MKSPDIYSIVVIVLISIAFMACDKVFEFSPYEAAVNKKNHNTTANNLQLIKNIRSNPEIFKFAFVTDNHCHYNNLRIIVDDINKRSDVVFVIFGGDITDQAFLKEYQHFYIILKNLHKPYLTVIGNHDYKLNGASIYRQMFGDVNYSFEFKNNKFIIFDDIVWESNVSPDFNWLSAQLTDNALFNQVFVFAHIPPFGDQFDNEMEQQYRSLMKKNNVHLSLHGHIHRYSFEKVYADNVNYLTGPWLKKPTYCIVSVNDKSFDIELIEL